jgi:ABC-type antimicrobial peptide transport system permease subunit
MALGAERADVLRLVVRTGLRLVISGMAIGLAVSLGAAKVIATQLWGVSPYDAETLVTVPILLLLVGLAACWIPAQRAARVDPLVALRHE